MDSVFDVFDEVSYQFLKISRGGVYGNIILQTYDAVGVADIDEGMITANNQEAYQSSSLLYVHPDEEYITEITENGKVNFVGNGIRVDHKDYEIVGSGVGRNQDNGTVEHFELTLQAADFSEYQETS